MIVHFFMLLFRNIFTVNVTDDMNIFSELERIDYHLKISLLCALTIGANGSWEIE